MYPVIKLLPHHNIAVKYRYSDSYRLKPIPQGDWIDLATDEDVTLKKFEFALIHLGVAMQLPVGYEVNIVPRSSTFIKHGIIQTNSFGVIDNSYRGDDDWWKFPALAMRDTYIPRGTRVCQFKIVPTQKSQFNVFFYEVDSFNETSRGGFGSTDDICPLCGKTVTKILNAKKCPHCNWVSGV